MLNNNSLFKHLISFEEGDDPILSLFCLKFAHLVLQSEILTNVVSSSLINSSHISIYLRKVNRGIVCQLDDAIHYHL